MENENVYYHNYLFRHNEKRCYKNKLTILGEGTIYLGITLEDKTNRHWLPVVNEVVDTGRKILGKPVLSKKERRDLVDSGVKVIAEKKIVDTWPIEWPKIGNNAPNGYKHYYEHNGLVLSFKRPKLPTYFKNILNCEGEVKYLGVLESKPQPTISTPYKSKITDFRLFVCCYCETPLNQQNYTREHIIPTFRGGGNTQKNLRPCCYDCNQEKNNFMLHTYIQILNLQLHEKTGDDLITLQTKIKNANMLAKELGLSEDRL